MSWKYGAVKFWCSFLSYFCYTLKQRHDPFVNSDQWKTWLICEKIINNQIRLTIFIKGDENDDAWHEGNIILNGCEKHTIGLLLQWKLRNYCSLAPNYRSLVRILIPKILFGIYSVQDKLSVSVEETSSEHKQGLHPKRERENYTVVGHCCSDTKI